MTAAGATSKDTTDKVIETKPDNKSFEEFDANSVVVIPVNDDSKKIRQIFSNDTSMKILDLLKKESLSASEVAEKLEIPLTTAKYNIDQMVEHDLVRIQRIKYSEKGRQVKIYEAPEKVIVFAPEKMSRISLFSMLQKYAFAFVAAAFAGFGLNYIYQGQRDNQAQLMRLYGQDYEFALDSGAGIAHNTIMTFTDLFFNIMNSHAFWFIAGALFVCIFIWMVEYITVQKKFKSE